MQRCGSLRTVLVILCAWTAPAFDAVAAQAINRSPPTAVFNSPTGQDGTGTTPSTGSRTNSDSGSAAGSSDQAPDMRRPTRPPIWIMPQFNIPTRDDRVEVPDLTSRTLQEGTQELEHLGLVIKPDRQPRAGSVAFIDGQSPAAGKLVPKGTEVSVTLGIAMVRVPAVLGLTAAQAQKALGAARLTMGLTPSSGDTEDKIATQDPAAGQTVESGSSVTVTLTQATTVPDLAGLSIEIAKERLERSGLILSGKRRSDAGLVDRIVRQQPVAGARVTRGSSVGVWLEVIRPRAKPVPPVPAPAVLQSVPSPEPLPAPVPTISPPAPVPEPLSVSMPVRVPAQITLQPVMGFVVIGLLLLALITTLIRYRRRHRLRWQRLMIAVTATKDAGTQHLHATSSLLTGPAIGFRVMCPAGIASLRFDTPERIDGGPLHA